MPRKTHPSGPRVPGAILISGPAGSGKTTLAVALATRLGYTLADLDTITGPLTSVALSCCGSGPDGLDSPVGQRLRAARYAALLDVAGANLAIGNGVVAAAPFTVERCDPGEWSRLVSRLRRQAETVGVALLFIDVPADVRRRRLSERGEPRDHAKLQGEPRSPGAGRLVDAAIVVDGTATVDLQLAAALHALERLTERTSTVLHPSTC